MGWDGNRCTHVRVHEQKVHAPIQKLLTFSRSQMSQFVPEAKSYSTTSPSLWSSLHHRPCSEPHWLCRPVLTIPDWTPWTDLCCIPTHGQNPSRIRPLPASETRGPSKIM